MAGKIPCCYCYYRLSDDVPDRSVCFPGSLPVLIGDPRDGKIAAAVVEIYVAVDVAVVDACQHKSTSSCYPCGMTGLGDGLGV